MSKILSSYKESLALINLTPTATQEEHLKHLHTHVNLKQSMQLYLNFKPGAGLDRGCGGGSILVAAFKPDHNLQDRHYNTEESTRLP